MTSKANEQKSLSLKEQGNACIKEQKYAEAMLHYTHAIKLDSKNPQLYSNRSLAFLKLYQFYYALDDANQAIRLKPDWAKAYFRKGEVEYSAQQYEAALASYKKAMTLDYEDATIKDAVKRTTKELQATRTADARLPWIGTGLGVLVGVLIVVGDELTTKQPSLSSFILKILIIIATSLVGFGISRGYRYYMKIQKESLMERPVDLFGEDEAQDSSKEEETVASQKTKKSFPNNRSAGGLARKRAAARHAS